MTGHPATAVVVPIRSFRGALSRLVDVLNESQRRALMRRMAARVVAAAEGYPTFVVTDDAEVAAWAGTVGATAMRVGRPGLSTAAAVAVGCLADTGIERAVVAHADLALVRSLRPAMGPGLTIVPDRQRDGSNVVCVPTSAGFHFAYGPDSFGRHVAEAERLGLAVTVVEDESLTTDIDHPEDLMWLPREDRLSLHLDALEALP